MKKAILIILNILVIFMVFNVTVYAQTLNINVNSDKTNVKIDEIITVTVDWQDKMQAADFILNYDNTRFEFVDIDIDNAFYKVENSKIEVAWFSIDDIDKTNITIHFKALKSGKADFNVAINGGFATGDLLMPDDYNINNTSVKVKGISFGEILPMIIILVLIILTTIIINIKKSKK